MHFAALFVIAAGLVLLIVLGFLWPRPEYGLLAWGIALGFPDAVIPMGAVNLRIDDVLLLLLLPRTFIWSIGDTRSQKSTRAVQFAFLGLCCFSIVIEFLNGNPPPGYEVAKMLGCGLILFSLPRLVEGQRTLRFLLVGLMIGGVALTCQIAYRLLHSSGNVLANFQELKSAATFATWNPNTIGQAGILLA
ncbi:MAG: hypothetical protein JO061_12380, partial [Acidobacteriaceae bacterium]|nr:hypothetical protein [Acidobacteriaceae bacterium]